MRKNGVAAPYNAMQVGTWFLLPSIVLQFILFITPVLPTIVSVLVTVLFAVCACCSCYYAYMTSATDPVDARLYKALKEKEGTGNGGDAVNDQLLKENGKNGNANGGSNGNISSAEEGNNSDNKMHRITGPCIQCITPPSPSIRMPPNPDTSTQEEEQTKFCWVCQARVEIKSMHCKFCDKCVSHFDHHCQWLNTCIGDANYMYFLKTIACLCVMSYVQVFCSAAVLTTHFNSHGDVTYEAWWFSRPNYSNQETIGLVWLIFTFTFLILNTGVAMLITQLLFFHFQLYNRQITTYEYIIQDNAKRRDKERFAIALESKRRMELLKYSNKKLTMSDTNNKARLVLGGFTICKCVDPLQQNQPLYNKNKSKTNAPSTDTSTIITNTAPLPTPQPSNQNGSTTKTTTQIEESKSQEQHQSTPPIKIKTTTNGGGVLSSNTNNKTKSQQIESLDVVPNPNHTNGNNAHILLSPNPTTSSQI